MTTQAQLCQDSQEAVIYPRGAVKGLVEFQRLVGKTVWNVSKTHSTNRELFAKRTVVGIEFSPYTETLFYEYVNTHGVNKSSLLDANVLGSNGYNDWYLFPCKEDAEKYLGKKLA